MRPHIGLGWAMKHFPASASPRLRPFDRCQSAEAGRRTSQASLMGDQSPSAHEAMRVVPVDGRPKPAAVRPQGFLTLSTAFTRSALPALFHAGGAHGVAPSEHSLPTRLPRRFHRGAPTYRSRRRYSHRKR